MDTVINVVPNADIYKTQNHIFFIYIKNINFCVQIFCQDIFGCGMEPSSTKKLIFLSTMAGKDGKVTFSYISLSYLK